MTKSTLCALVALMVLAGCSSKPTLLPDEGPTTVQIIEGDYSNPGADRQDGSYPVSGEPVNLVRHPQSNITGRHLDELNQDFKEVPNPKILGYVYPHFNSGNMPVPGYFTSFRLYKQNHYALMEEGAAEGWTQ